MNIASSSIPTLPVLIHRAIPQSLTPRQHEVLAMVPGGLSKKEEGRRLGISTRPFESHSAHLTGKLGARNAADLVRVAPAERP